ncbi:MAG: hypothetical protein EOO16_17530 [Chitinophagaceae bacterium]|nr:MAG: hypothetical protein EOO16_17530 [Chitinophagaceae bacterium]
MKTSQTILSVFALSALMASCTQQYYRPRPNDPPLLSEAGQVKATGSLSLTGSPMVSAAWSPVRGLGVQGGFSSSRTSGFMSDGSTRNDFRERRSLVYGGVGYYRKLSPNTLFEVYGGVGSAGFSADGTGPVSRLRMTNYYVQPAVGLVRDNLELAFSVRYDHLQRGLTRLDSSRYGLFLDGDQKFLRFQGYDLLQPGITFRAGWPEAKFHLDISESFVLNSDYESLYGDSRQNGLLRLTIGLNLSLHKLFK